MPTLSRDQLLPLIRKYFGTGEEDKWLHLINGESGGRSDAVGDKGAAWGLFQDQHIPQGSSIEQQFASAKRLYDADKRNGGTGFGDWGEGRLYNGKPFGALGNNPYRGGSSSMTSTPTSSASSTDMDAWIESQIGPIPKVGDFPPLPSDAKNGDSPAERFSNALQAWVSNKAKLVPAYRAAFPTPADRDPGPITQGFQQQKIDQDAVTQQISLLDTQLNAGKIDAATAQAKLSAFLTSRTQADQEAQLVANSNDLLAKYGVAPGHEKDTAKQWGDAFVTFAKLLGGDENSIPRDFTGQTAFSDPTGDIQRFRAQNGALGDAPSLGSSTAMTDMVNGKVPGLLGNINGAAAPRTYSNGGYDAPEEPPSGIPGVSPGVGSPNGAFVDPATGGNGLLSPGAATPAPSIADIISQANGMPHGGYNAAPPPPMGPQPPPSLLADIIKRRGRGLLAGAF